MRFKGYLTLMGLKCRLEVSLRQREPMLPSYSGKGTVSRTSRLEWVSF